jgi:putative ABC transport system permease protein
MRSFSSLAVRQVRARRARSLLTAAGIVLGVGMILGVLLLTVTIHRTFTDLFDSVYGRTDLIVSGAGSAGGGTSLRPETIQTVRDTPGVEQASGQVQSIFTLVIAPGEAATDQSAKLNVAGQRRSASRLSDARTVGGRKPRRGLEIALQRSWAEANDLGVGDRVDLATPTGIRTMRVVGLFDFPTGLDFGGQGFGTMPLGAARRVMDKARAFDEIDIAVDGGTATISRVQHELRRALFVGGFLIFNSFNMTVFQRTRELGMLRTLGAGRWRITLSVLQEAVLLGVIGAVFGLGLGVALAYGLVELMRALAFPVGSITFASYAPVAAIATGLLTAVLGALYPARRAGRTQPIRAVIGSQGLRSRLRPRRGLLGVVLIILGFAGAWWLGAADETTTLVAVAGMVGTIAIFFGIALLAPFVIRPLVRALSWPLRRLFPVEGRLAADAARSDPGRTAATATALMIGLALVVAVNSLGSSFLKTISDEFDQSFARDLTVQPSGFAPGQGPQQTIATGLRKRLARIPQAAVVANERFLYVPRLPGRKGKKGDGLLFGFNPLQYEQVDTTTIEGAPRDQVYRRLAGGWVTVGKGWAQETDLGVGDAITVRGPSGTVHTRVAGIVETVLFGGQTVGMSLQTLNRAYGVTADSELALKATSADARPTLMRKVERIVERRYPNLAVLSNDELKSKVENQVNQQFAIFYAIVGVAIFASLFGIVNTLTMSVIERTREIGVLRALGASRWQVRRSIADESLVIGLIGALLGIAVGAGLGYALLQGLSSGIPGVVYRPPVSTMVAVAVAGVILGLIASVLPARRAARLDVIRAISYE